MVGSPGSRLRSGFTTGACAAAAAKAAILSLNGYCCSGGSVEIPFPDGQRRGLSVKDCFLVYQDSFSCASASVIKDAGDDPDVTNGAEIIATVCITSVPLPLAGRASAGSSQSVSATAALLEAQTIIVKGGEGIGTVTKPGLAVAVGEPAINPVPRAMILDAAGEALRSCRQVSGNAEVTITISVPNGKALAKKTLNYRLGIVGGISILGTTGIVTPLSAESWKATIGAGMDVAKATGCEEVVLSAGRASEKAHMRGFNLPEEAYVMMGDHLEFSVLEAAARGFGRIHVAAQWAKLLKIAMAKPQTHVRFGDLQAQKAAVFLRSIGVPLPAESRFNTAREIFEFLNAAQPGASVHFEKTCAAAGKYLGSISRGVPVTVHLAGYEGSLVKSVPAGNKNS